MYRNYIDILLKVKSFFHFILQETNHICKYISFIKINFYKKELSFSIPHKLFSILIDLMDQLVFLEHSWSWKDFSNHDIWILSFILCSELIDMMDMVFEEFFEQMLQLLHLFFHSSLWDIGQSMNLAYSNYFEIILNRFLTHLHRFFVFMLMNSQVVG